MPKIKTILIFLSFVLFLILPAQSQTTLSMCVSYSGDTYSCYRPNVSPDFNENYNGNLRPGSYGSMGSSPMDRLNFHLQTRNQVPENLKREVHKMELAIANDNEGKFSEVLIKGFNDLRNLTNGIEKLEFLPPSIIPPPVPKELDTPELKNELNEFYRETSENNFESSKNRVNATIIAQNNNPTKKEKFWWKEIRRNHTDQNGVLTSLPYQNLQKLSLSNSIESLEGQFTRVQFNNAMTNNATLAHLYVKSCHENGNCGVKSEEARQIMNLNAGLQNTERTLKFIDENSSWGYDVKELTELVAKKNQSNQNFITNGQSLSKGISKDDLMAFSVEQLFESDAIDQVIGRTDNGINDLVEWPEYKKTHFSDPIEKSNQNSADLANCVASINICKQSGVFDALALGDIPTIDNVPVNELLAKTIAREKQLLSILQVRKKIEDMNFSGVQGGKFLKDVGRYAAVASAGLALSGHLEDSESFKAIATEVLDIGLGLVPFVSVGKDLYEVLSGENILTGRKLSTIERVLAGVGVVSLGTSNYAKTLLKGLSKVAKNVPTNLIGKVVDGAISLGAKSQESILRYAKNFKTSPHALTKSDTIAKNIAKSPEALKAYKATAASRPAFYVTAENVAIPATAYRHFGSDSIQLIEKNIIATGKIPSHPTVGNYITFNKFDNAAVASNKLQVPHDARYRVEIDTQMNVGDIRIPNGKWGEADFLEPITKTMPEFGAGGATQAVTKLEIPGVLEVKDLVTGKILFQK